MNRYHLYGLNSSLICISQYPGSEDESPGMYERRLFSAMVTGLDIAIGRVVEALREKGLYDNSIILFSSDVSDQSWN